MKKFLSVFVMALTIGLVASAQSISTKIETGQIAPELAYPNPEGKMISLKEVVKGRYVLVDFWASWCGPCRRANPELVELYEKYKTQTFKHAPKGFTVFSVSLDGGKEPWVKAIEKDKLSWNYHVSDFKKWESEAAATYGVRSIPQAFLIGPDGKVLGKYQTALEAVADLEQYIGVAPPAKKSGKKAPKTKS